MEKQAVKTLKQYLSQYTMAKRRQALLLDRMAMLSRDLLPGTGADAQQNRMVLDSIMAQIDAHRLEQQRKCLAVLSILDFLPTGSIERDILELRHIDGKTWAAVEALMGLSRAQLFREYSRGIRNLGRHPKVQEILSEFIR